MASALLPLVIAFLVLDSALSAPCPLLPTASDDDGPAPDGNGWSSMVGIVASVAGNVLISFALNLQRYSHIRIDREFQQRLALKRAQAYSDNEHIQMTSQGYGTCALGGRPAMDDNGDAATNDSHSSTSEYNTRRSIPSTTSSTRLAVIEEARRQSYLQSSYWWAGLLLMILGEAGNFMAYGFAPASVISPLGVVAIISNCLIAPLMLRETLRRRDSLGVLVSIIGTIIIVVSFHPSEKTIGPEDLFNMFATTTFVVYVTITTTVIVVFMWMSETCGARSILIDVGLVGLFALMQIRYINRALQRFDSTQVIPTQFVSFTICVIIGSAVVYRDFESATFKEAAIFTGGCALTFFGVYLITSRRPKVARLMDVDEEAQNADCAAVPNIPVYTDEDEPVIDERPVAIETEVSPAHSLLDVDDMSEGEDVGSMTPRARSPLASVSEVSSLLASGTTTGSSTRLQSRSRSPFIEGQSTAEGDATLLISPTSNSAQEIQLRFPSAPCVGADSQAQMAHEPRIIERDSEQIPRNRLDSNASRNMGYRSLSTSGFFTPGPFLAPISGGITAILAESLNRNGPDDLDHTRSYTNSTYFVPGLWDLLQSHDVQGKGHENARNGPRRSRADTTTPSSRPSACPIGQRQSNVHTASDCEPRFPSRIRSFSDSLSGSLSWINTAVWRKQRETAAPGQGV
ncbi:hypothetical protein KEM56_002599 [Ascosphaera pollenicola]|nr:hypothetical protein KEM56_002599 [Ascosphaera pollenicola]